MKKTLTRKGLVESLAKNMTLSLPKATQLLEYALEAMTGALAEEGVLKIASFGSFKVRQKSKRMGRNPKTGEESVITPRRVVSFSHSPHLRSKAQSRKAP